MQQSGDTGKNRAREARLDCTAHSCKTALRSPRQEDTQVEVLLHSKTYLKPSTNAGPRDRDTADARTCGPNCSTTNDTQGKTATPRCRTVGRDGEGSQCPPLTKPLPMMR